MRVSYCNAGPIANRYTAFAVGTDEHERIPSGAKASTSQASSCSLFLADPTNAKTRAHTEPIVSSLVEPSRKSEAGSEYTTHSRFAGLGGTTAIRLCRTAVDGRQTSRSRSTCGVGRRRFEAAGCSPGRESTLRCLQSMTAVVRDQSHLGDLTGVECAWNFWLA